MGENGPLFKGRRYESRMRIRKEAIPTADLRDKLNRSEFLCGYRVQSTGCRRNRLISHLQSDGNEIHIGCHSASFCVWGTNATGGEITILKTFEIIQLIVRGGDYCFDQKDLHVLGWEDESSLA